MLGHLFSSKAMKQVFSDEATLTRWLEVEAALASVQAGYGVMPEEAAVAIHNACSIDLYNLDELGQHIAKASHPLTPVIVAIENNAGEHGQYVHYGATTQDIMDTGMMLQIRDGLDLAIRAQGELVTTCTKQARKWRDLPMAGRTHGQHAVPITLGLKFALWASEANRHVVRLKALRSDLTVQFAGAAGTLATLGGDGARVRAGLARALCLKDPQESWHTTRDPIALIVSQLCISSATCGKIANEVVNLQRTEIGELAEGAAAGTGGSSTMPQKRNPMMAQNIAALARLMAAKPATALEAMMHEHERDMAALTLEWVVVPESFIYAHAALDQTVQLVSHIQVNKQRIAENLRATGGLICSEAVMMDLASDMGRSEAHHVIADIVAETVQSGTGFTDALCAHPQISKLRTREQIEALLEPENYLGEAVEVVDRIVRELEGSGP
jgi:adenylosuccinate lyase